MFFKSLRMISIQWFMVIRDGIWNKNSFLFFKSNVYEQHACETNKFNDVWWEIETKGQWKPQSEALILVFLCLRSF